MAPAVAKNGLPKMIGVLESSLMSMTMKSAGIKNFPKCTGTFSSIPRGYLTERSANWMDILVGRKSPNLSFSHMDMGIKLMLAPKSHRALSIMYGPITQGME